ncbi:hypothetical protein DAI22_03g240200 [Oryza sativa Japonica Group]|nr:hypothetical protein DAI22_03g240200 [Oryza sativa Japonica Group]
MASRLVAAAAASSSSSPLARLVSRRGLAGAADHHGPPKVNIWQEPMNPANWKEEQVSIPLDIPPVFRGAHVALDLDVILFY